MERKSFLLKMLAIALIFLAATIGLSVGYPRQWHFYKAGVMIFNVGICLWLYTAYRRCKKSRRLVGIFEEQARASDVDMVIMTFMPLTAGFIIAFLPEPWSTGEFAVIMALVSLYCCRVLYIIGGKDLLRYLKVRGLCKKTKKAGIL